MKTRFEFLYVKTNFVSGCYYGYCDQFNDW